MSDTCEPGNCCSGVENLCLDNIDSTGFFGVLFECMLLIYAFVAVAIIADEHLVCSLETLCVRWSVREDVAGASFMAFGSAAPEIIINAISTLKTVLASGRGDDDPSAGDDTSLGIGAIIGSGMIAFSFIPGCCGLAASGPLELKRRPLGRDISAYLLALILLGAFISDGKVEASESAVMVTLYVMYMLIVIFASKIRENFRVNYLGRAARSKSSFVVQAQESLNPSAQGGGNAPLSPAADGSGAESGQPSFNLEPLGALAQLGPSAADDARAPVFNSPSSSTPHAPAAGSSSGPGSSSSSGSGSSFQIMTSSTSSPMTAGQILPADRPINSRLACLPHDTAAALQAIYRWSCIGGRWALMPLQFALKCTCPECAHDSPGARLYPVTLVSSFIWVAFFSTVISAVVTRGGDMLGIPKTFLGMYVIAIGAEIPDTIQSVTVAKRGYGSMAVSNSTGSQIINILIGLGVPWAIMNMSGRDVPIPEFQVGDLHLMASLQGINVLIYLSLLLLPTFRTWRPGDHSKALLDRTKGKVLLSVYAAVLCLFPILWLIMGGGSRSDAASPPPPPNPWG
uniref:Sodium/calcium exchanger membrane region domain-containing protein n=1 Tax=Haptolina brevifila TaxID=156173 RepID=A0A7S2GP88_9EUKA